MPIARIKIPSFSASVSFFNLENFPSVINTLIACFNAIFMQKSAKRERHLLTSSSSQVPDKSCIAVQSAIRDFAIRKLFGISELFNTSFDTSFSGLNSIARTFVIQFTSFLINSNKKGLQPAIPANNMYKSSLKFGNKDLISEIIAASLVIGNC